MPMPGDAQTRRATIRSPGGRSVIGLSRQAGDVCRLVTRPPHNGVNAQPRVEGSHGLGG